MKKFNVLFIALVLMMSMLFIGCDMFGGDDGVTVNYIDKDGFGLKSATVAFDNSSSVSNLNSSSTEDNGRFYVPTDYATLNVATPTISFTFNENLSSDSIKAVFRVDNGEGFNFSNGSILEGIFTNVANASVDSATGTGIACTDVSVSGATVTFSFEEDTFAFDAYYFVEFGVTSAKGEMYKVTTCFQPQTDVNAAPVITSFFASELCTDQYYSYAVDNNEVYLLANESDDIHTVEEDAAETIVAVNSRLGYDFGGEIDNYSERFENLTDGDDTYASLDDMKDEIQATPPTGRGQIYTSYMFILTPRNIETEDYTTSYHIYWEDADGDRTLATGVSSVTYDEYNTDGDITSLYYIYSVSILDADHPIALGDKIVAVPYNSRGEFENHETVYAVADTVRPFHEGVIDNLKASSTLQHTAITYSNHNHHDAESEGEIELVDSFTLTTELDSTWRVEESNVSISFTSGAMAFNPGIDLTSGNGSQMSLTPAQLVTYLESEGTTVEEADCYNLGNNLVGLYNKATNTISIYVHLACHHTSSTVTYPVLSLNGSLNYTVTDASNNNLLAKVTNTTVDDDTEREITNGALTVFFAE